jgi:hypothetical protein
MDAEMPVNSLCCCQNYVALQGRPLLLSRWLPVACAAAFQFLASMRRARTAVVLLALVLLVCVCSSVLASSTQQRQQQRELSLQFHDDASLSAEASFLSFQRTFNRSYASSSESARRLRIFSRNLDWIRTHNAERYAKGLSGYAMAVNDFADLSYNEWRTMIQGPQAARRNMQQRREHMEKLQREHELHRQAQLNQQQEQPRSSTTARRRQQLERSKRDDDLNLDWRLRNAVTPIKNQVGCNGAYAFGAVAAIEAAHALQHIDKYGNATHLQALSDAQVIDCSYKQRNQGCDGGSVLGAFQYAMLSSTLPGGGGGGLDRQSDYPFHGDEGWCRSARFTPVANLSSFVSLAPGNESALADAVATAGPVAVYIDSSQQAWQFYSMGILDDETCGTVVDHALAVIGYGVDDGKTKMPYFIIKNSCQWRFLAAMNRRFAA